MAKNWSKPWEMTHSSEAEIFWGGPHGKVVAPGILGICPLDKNRNSKTKKLTFGPEYIQILESRLHIFVPCGQLEPHRSMFSTRKRCLIGSLIWGYQKFYSLPKKWTYGPTTAKFGPKKCEQGAWVVFLSVGTKTFASSREEKDFWPKNDQIWPKIWIFGHFRPNIGASDPFSAMPDQNNNANEVPRWFSDLLVPEFFLPPEKNGHFCPKICFLWHI